MPTQDKYAHWRALLAANKITKLLQELREELAKSDRLDEIVQQSARYSALRKNIRLGVISYDDGKLTEAQIQLALGEFLTEMEELEQTDAVVARQLSHKAQENPASNIPHFLTPKPQQPEIFVGREDQLEALHDQLFAPNADHFLLLVNGEGGIGKTSLAAAYFHRYHEQYAHAAWVLGETSIAGALLTLSLELKLEFGPTEDTNQRLHRLMTRLANLGDTCLLVVDNANSLEDLDANYEILRRCDNFHLLLTSRLSTYARAQLVAIEPLKTDTAQDLFSTHYRPLSKEEIGLFPSVYQAVGGNTLVLEILAKNLRRVNTLRERYTLADLLTDLQEKGLLQLVESRTVETQYGKLRRAEPAEIIGAMYELEELTPPQLKLLSVFAALPPDNISVAHLEVLLDDFAELEEPLLDLAQRGWVVFDAEEGSFRCSQVVQEVTRKNQPNFIELVKPIGKSLENLLETVGYQYPVRKISEVRPFFPYVHSYLRCLPNSTSRLFLFQQLGDFYRAGGDLRSSFEQYQGLRQSAKLLLDEFADDNLNKALEFFEQYNALEKELHAAYPDQVGFKNVLAISYEKLGETHSSLSNLNKALEFFEQNNALEKELHAAYPDQVDFKNGLAISYVKLGEVAEEAEQKRVHYQKAEQLWVELTEAFPDYAKFQ